MSTDSISPAKSVPLKSSPVPQKNLFGFLGFLCSLGGLLTCGVLAPVGLILSLIGLRREPRTLAVVGSVLSGVTTVVASSVLLLYGLIMSIVIDLAERDRPKPRGWFDLDSARRLIELGKNEDGEYPDAVTGNRYIAAVKDSWQGTMRYEPLGRGYLIRSAGPDKRFDTDDDLTIDEAATVHDLSSSRD